MLDILLKNKEKQLGDEKYFDCQAGNRNPASRSFLVTFYSYPARNVVDKEKSKKEESNKIVTRNFQLSCPTRPQ